MSQGQEKLQLVHRHYEVSLDTKLSHNALKLVLRGVGPVHRRLGVLMLWCCLLLPPTQLAHARPQCIALASYPGRFSYKLSVYEAKLTHALTLFTSLPLFVSGQCRDLTLKLWLCQVSVETSLSNYGHVRLVLRPHS